MKGCKGWKRAATLERRKAESLKSLKGWLERLSAYQRVPGSNGLETRLDAELEKLKRLEAGSWRGRRLAAGGFRRGGWRLDADS